MDRAEEISLAFEYGAKARIDRKLELSKEPPAHWPERAKQEFREGYSWADEKCFLRWGTRYGS